MSKSKKKKGVSDKVRLAKSRKNAFNKIAIEQRNPFEVKVNKQKHTILGRKQKHDKGLPGVSRSKSTKKRKDTLLHEYKYMNKANQIKDERLGANDKQLSLEEKMLQRYALEKKKKHEKLAQFNLNDEEELTHLGQSLSSITKFDDALVSDDEDGTLTADYVEQAHFGGGMFKKKANAENGEAEQPKSRKDVMLDIIAKSKTAKYERQSEKEKSDQLLAKIDSDWQLHDLRMVLKPSLRTKQDKQDDYDRARKDDYNMTLRAMIYDRKATPGERPKTQEELAKEKEAVLRKQEQERLARMKFTQAEKKTQHQSADALCDDFLIAKKDENASFLAYPIINDPPSPEEENEIRSNEDENENSEEEEKDSEVADQGIVDDGTSLEDDDQEEESDNYSDIDSGNEDDADLISLAESEMANHIEEVKPPQNASVSNFPSSYTEYASLIVGSRSAAELTQKLRKDFAPSARKGNKAKMIELFAYVWEHCCRMASLSPPNMSAINALCRHLYELCELNLDSCTDCVLERLKRSYLYCFSSRRSARPRWPKFEMLMQFKLIKLFYSTSDYSHVIATRSLIFICKTLNDCRVSKMRDLACGLFLCTLAYEYVCFSKRFLPECLNFLCTSLSMSLPKDVQRELGLPQIVALHLTKTNCDFLSINVKSDGFPGIMDKKLNLIQLLDDSANMEINDTLKLQFLITSLKLIEKFAELYLDIPSYDEVFSPLSRVCEVVVNHQNLYSKFISDAVMKTLSLLKKNFQQPRKPLRFEPKKPKPLRLFDPKIQAVGEPFDKKFRNLTAQQKEKERLVHKHKRELKGATREIRKDAIFLARQRQKEQEEKDAERRDKVKQLYGLLSNQEGEVRQIKRRKYTLEI